MQADKVRDVVRKTYGEIAVGETRSGCCGPGSSCGCSEQTSRALGYSDDDLNSAPEGSNLGLGCGNPQAIAALQPGERVLDLGSGAGFDGFLAARQVGPAGSVIGVDMTAEMVARARSNTEKTSLANVEFRLGEIERLPVADESVDVIMSNCVINLSTDKPAVFREAYRVLAPGGRLAISDIVATRPLPPEIAGDLAAYTGCVAGAGLVSDLDRMLRDAGFADVRITPRNESRSLLQEWSPGRGVEDYVVSALIEAVKRESNGQREGLNREVSGSEPRANAAEPTTAPACCESTLYNSCCEPEAKAECCDVHTAPSVCGCNSTAR
jgi:SAM-dependent methyltransferase